MSLEVQINTCAWYGDKEETLSFPDEWDVSVYKTKDVAALDESQVDRAFAEPIGSERIDQLARGKKTAAIIVDDLSRPTPANLLTPRIVDELKRGGIKEESIRFVIGGGSHRPLTTEEMAKKVGHAVASKYEIHNHNVFSKTLVDLGHLEDGTPVHINEVVAASDLKIAVGGVIPHGGAGFGGGGKIVVPGVAGFDTIAHNHGKCKGRGLGSIERLGEEKDMRDNAEDVARHIGLDFMLNIVLTKKREIAGLFAGDVIESHHQAKLLAKDICDTVIPEPDVDATNIVISNAYPQDPTTQTPKSMWPSDTFKNAQMVMLIPACDGIRYHGMSDKVDYKTFVEMKASEQEPTNIPKKAVIKSKKDFVVLSENFPKGEFYKLYANGVLLEDWTDLIGQLKQLHGKAKVAVFPYAPLQIPNVVQTRV